MLHKHSGQHHHRTKKNALALFKATRRVASRCQDIDGPSRRTLDLADVVARSVCDHGGLARRDQRVSQRHVLVDSTRPSRWSRRQQRRSRSLELALTALAFDEQRGSQGIRDLKAIASRVSSAWLTPRCEGDVGSPGLCRTRHVMRAQWSSQLRPLVACPIGQASFRHGQWSKGSDPKPDGRSDGPRANLVTGPKRPSQQRGGLRKCLSALSEFWLRGQDLNLRPLGYEPNELPGCSTPRLSLTVWHDGAGWHGGPAPGQPDPRRGVVAGVQCAARPPPPSGRRRP